jgi:hypothetical protein
MPVKVGDYVYDWAVGLLGLIVDQAHYGRFVLLYENGTQGEAFENALVAPVEKPMWLPDEMGGSQGPPRCVLPVDKGPLSEP